MGAWKRIGGSKELTSLNKQTRNKAYPQEFREQVVKLVQAGGQTVSEIAREFEISTDSVRRWLSRPNGTRAAARTA